MDFDKLHSIWNIFLDAGLVSLQQVLLMSGIFIVFGLLLYVFALGTQIAYLAILDYKWLLYTTGWIGTPIHELSHALMCIPFLHRIDEIKLFIPNSEDGTLGYVSHAYNHRSLWAQVGNFFIALGPVIGGSAILFLMIKYMLPTGNEVLSIITLDNATEQGWHQIWESLKQMVKMMPSVVATLFAVENLICWKFWVFLYVGICISAHMCLSLADLKGAWHGIYVMFVTFLVVNFLSKQYEFISSDWIWNICVLPQKLIGIFMLSTIVSAMNCVLTILILSIIRFIRNRKG